MAEPATVDHFIQLIIFLHFSDLSCDLEEPDERRKIAPNICHLISHRDPTERIAPEARTLQINCLNSVFM